LKEEEDIMAWYAKFDGVDGSGSHNVHKAWCNVASLNMSGRKAGGDGTGVGRVGGKMHLEDITMGITTDKKALPQLLDAAVKGKAFKKVEIQGTAPNDGGSEQVYLGIELENVQITSYQLSVLDILDNKPAPDRLSIVLSFEKHKWVFTT
jgi:type VI secretion system Hcp family effector